MSTTRLTVAQAIVRYLAAQRTARDGVEHRTFAGMFGIFGHGNVTGLGQALEEYRGTLTYYRPQNEQAMVHAAVAYARVKNRMEMFACTSSVGPGATNMVTGAALATVNRLPVLLLPGDIFANRKPHPVLQQVEMPYTQDISANDAFRPVSKYFDRINRPEQILTSLPEAMRVLTDPAETGAVTIALPEDVQTEAIEVPDDFLAERAWHIARTRPDAEAISRAARWISEAEHPMIIAGGGVIYSDATEALDEFSTQLGIPVAESQAGKGALRWDHPWNVGPIGVNGGISANRLARDADLVIAVGTRMGDFVSSSRTAFQHPDVRFIAINTMAMDAAKFGALPLQGDARASLQLLLDEVQNEGIVRDITETASQVTSLVGEWNAIVDDLRAVDDRAPITQAQVLGLVNDAAGDNGIVINAAGSMPGDLLKLWRATDPKQYHVEYGFSCMGYEVAGGLGIRMAAPDRNVFVLVGDGSYLMLHTEIVTAVQEGIKMIVILVDNGGFQSIHGLQMASGSPSFGNELRYRSADDRSLSGEQVPVDFVANAESLGARGYRASTAREFQDALQSAIDDDRTSLIAIRTDEHARVPNFEGWWDVPIAAVSDEASVNDARRAYERDIKKQRPYV